ncbi:MAG: hypothetical protein ACWIPH_06105 [Ostreibacterium sp.]
MLKNHRNLRVYKDKITGFDKNARYLFLDIDRLIFLIRIFIFSIALMLVLPSVSFGVDIPTHTAKETLPPIDY